MSIVEQQLNEVLEVTRKNKKTTERLEGNWELDRKDFSEFNSRLAHLEAEFRELKALIHQMPRQTKEKVVDAIQPIVESTDNLTETIEKKKIVVAKGKHFWEFWKKGG